VKKNYDLFAFKLLIRRSEALGPYFDNPLALLSFGVLKIREKLNG